MDKKKRRPEFSLSGAATGILGGKLGGFHAEVSHRYFESRARLELELEHVFFLANADLAPRHRGRYEAALGIIARYLRDIDLPPHVLGEFLELAHALSDLDRGIVHPMLVPLKVSHRNVNRHPKGTPDRHSKGTPLFRRLERLALAPLEMWHGGASRERARPQVAL